MKETSVIKAVVVNVKEMKVGVEEISSAELARAKSTYLGLSSRQDLNSFERVTLIYAQALLAGVELANEFQGGTDGKSELISTTSNEVDIYQFMVDMGVAPKTPKESMQEALDAMCIE